MHSIPSKPASEPLPSPACGARPAAPSGFTLVEVIFAMAIFAIGFLAVAAMLPTGTILQKDLQDRAEGGIIGRNALSIMKAKGIYNLSHEWISHLGGNGMYNNQAFYTLPGVAGGNSLVPMHLGALAFPGSVADTYGVPVSKRFKDMEVVSDANMHPVYSGAPTNAWVLSLCATVSHMPSCLPYWDTNGNNGDIGGYAYWNFGYSLHYSAGMLCSAGGYYNGWSGPYSLTDDWRTDGVGDHTRWGYGRVHAYKNRPIPGVTPGYFSNMDFSYPSSVYDISQRQVFSYIQMANRSTTPQGNDSCVDASTNDWRVIAITLTKPELSEASWNPAVKGWPEMVEGDLSLPDQTVVASTDASTYHRMGSADQHSTAGPQFKLSNTGAYFRSLSTRKIPVPGYAMSETYGGHMASGAAKFKGWCGRFNNRTFYYNGEPDKLFWDYQTVGCSTFHGVPVRDANNQYLIPVPMDILACVYDKASNLLLLRYPQCFARTPQAGNPRLAGAWANTYGSGGSWVDRRLRAGDTLVTLAGGYTLRIKTVLDEKAAGLALPASRGGPADWSDGTYQLVQVTPSLDSTNISDNVPVDNPWYANYEINSPNGWSLYRVIVGTPPVTGGLTTLSSVDALPVSGASGGGVVRLNNDMAE